MVDARSSGVPHATIRRAAFMRHAISTTRMTRRCAECGNALARERSGLLRLLLGRTGDAGHACRNCGTDICSGCHADQAKAVGDHDHTACPVCGGSLERE